MQTTNFNLRGIDQKVMGLLKREAEKRNTSINSLILDFIERSIGYSHKVSKPVYHDLDHLAGTWKDGDIKTFKENTKYFEKIDKDLWE